MALRKYTVPVPSKHTSADKNGKYPYVYHRSNYRRNDRGQPTHDRTLIGKLDPTNPDLMFPNDNYYKIYPNEEDRDYQHQRPSRFSSCGSTLFLSTLAEKLGVTALLETIFPHSYQEILQIAMYMVCRGNVMMYLDDFYEEHHPVYESLPRSKHLSEIYESIHKDSIWDFIEAWQTIATGGQREAICYDVTSISTAGRDIDLAERGYNRDHEHLSQINVGLFYGQTSQLPLCYELYNGSIHDLSHLETMMKIAEELNFRPGLFVMDRGYLTTDNILYLKETEIPFVMAITEKPLVFREALLKHSDEVRSFNNYSRRTGTGSVQIDMEIEGETFQLSVYYDGEKEIRSRTDLADVIERREKELRQRIGKKTRKRQEDYFQVEEEKGQITSVKRKQEKITEDAKLLGVFGILSSGVSMTADEILLCYRRRDYIEKHYDNMKNHLDFYRLRIHSTQVMEGKFFIGFIAQILYADLSRKLWSSEIEKQKLPVETTNKLLLELEKIKLVKYNRGNEFFNALTRKQKNILKLFDIGSEEFSRNASELA